MKPEGSLPSQQQPAACPYPELEQLTPRKTNWFCSDPFQYYPVI